MAHTLFRTVSEHRTLSIASASIFGVAVLGTVAYLIFRHKPGSEEIEAARRQKLMAHGRLVDGHVVDTGEDPPPFTVMYAYRVAGVEYVCGQDLSTLQHIAPSFRADLPVQVRYDPHNPFNSIVAAEEWTGLRST